MDIDHLVPLAEAWCSGANSKMWIHTKLSWDLRLQSAEKSTLQRMLNTC